MDGFRIDLASVLGRPRSGPFDPNAPLLMAIATDPVLSRVKLIAEPWDATGEGYRVGGFGVAWSEWNGRYRDAVRDFWRGHGRIGEVASRLTGSSDLYKLSGRRPWASVNFVTAHDGFTLRDLLSYERKHNEANGEHNRDGTDDNRSQNFGVEGDTASPVIRARRLGTARAMLGTLLLSTGTPMLLAGDERWRTQLGNNNAYCLDDPTSWTDWSDGPEAASLTAFTALVTGIRRGSPALQRDRYYRDGEVLWWHPDGRRLRGHDWHDGDLHSLGPAARGVAVAAARRDAGGAGDAAARSGVRARGGQHPAGRSPADRAAAARRDHDHAAAAVAAVAAAGAERRRVVSTRAALRLPLPRVRADLRGVPPDERRRTSRRAAPAGTPTPSSCCPRWPSPGGPARPPRAARPVVAVAAAAAPDPAAHATRRVSATWC